MEHAWPIPMEQAKGRSFPMERASYLLGDAFAVAFFCRL